MTATLRPLLALTAYDLMSRYVVMISEDTPVRAAAELFLERQIGEAAVIDADGRCVGMLSATDLLHGALRAVQGAEDAPPSACLNQVKGRLLTGADAVICTRPEGNCPLQKLRPMTGGRRMAVCLLRDGPASDSQQVSRGATASAVRRYMTTDSTVRAGAPVPVVARAAIDARVPRLIVVDHQHRPIGTVSCLDALAALARPRSSAMGN